jgi:hypothetical protein
MASDFTAVRPFGARGGETADNLRECPFLSQYAGDQTIDWIRLYPDLIPHGSHLETVGGVSLVEINSSKIYGVTLGNGGVVPFRWDLPHDIDLTKRIDFAVKLSNSEAVDATKTHGWALTYMALINGTTAVAVPATTTGVTNGTATANIGANKIQISNASYIAAATVAAMGLSPGLDTIHGFFTVTLTGAADATAYAIGVKYYRRQIG